MLLALLALALIAAALAAPIALRAIGRWREARAHGRLPADSLEATLYDPGRERRAEQRARELLRSCVNAEEWAMYRDLGFLRVGGRHSRRGRDRERDSLTDGKGRDSKATAPGARNRDSHDWEPNRLRDRGGDADRSAGLDDAAAPDRTADRARARAKGHAYAYLIYPHKPIVAYVPSSGQLLSEYCVEFPDLSGSERPARLPASDDVLAKWMALTSDEDRLIGRANMHLVGRQHDPARVRRDLWRLAEWERRRERRREVGATS